MDLITNDIEIKENEIQPMKLTNYEDLKNEIVAEMQKYKDMEVTEDKLKEAKTFRANLNKFEKAIADQRIAKTREAEEKLGITKYIEDCKDLEKYVKETSTSLDKQIKEFEQKNKDKKLNEITTFFAENIGEFADLIDFDKIYNEKWLNATYKIEDIQKEILQIFTKTRTHFKLLDEQFKNEDESINKQVKSYYLNNINNKEVLTYAILEGNKIIEKNKKLEELSKTEEKQIEKTDEIPPKVDENIAEKIYEFDFRITATKKQLDLLKEFLKDNNIKIVKI